MPVTMRSSAFFPLFKMMKGGSRTMLQWTNSLQTRLLAVVLSLLLLLGVVLGAMAYWRQSDLVEERMLLDVQAGQDLLFALWRDEGKRVHALAEMIVLIPGVQEAFEERDREKVFILTFPLYRMLNEEHGIGQVQFHLPSPASFLRMNSPERFGDDLSFRKALVWVNRERKAFVGAEQGRTGMFVRGLIPVLRDGRHLGSLEVGSDVQPLLRQAYAETGAHYALFSTEAEIKASGFVPEEYIEGHPLLFSTDQSILSRIPEGYLAKALNGETVHRLQGNDKFLFSPVTNSMDEIVGVLATHVDASVTVAALTELRRIFALVVAASVLIGFLLLLAMLRSLVLVPLRKVTSLSSAMALDGQLGRNVPEELLRREDEIGLLARSVQNLAASLRKQIEALGDVAAELEEQSGHILKAISRMAEASEETAASVMETTATLQEIHTTAGLTDEKSRSVAANAKRGLQSAKTADESMGRLREGLDRIGERMPQLAEMIIRLDSRCREIAEITDTVEEISDQSAILAVNAALEAAKSAEHGKGFGVVAREIRSLAEHSKQSALQVQSILKEIRKAAADAVSAAEQGVEVVEAGTREAIPSMESVKKISAELVESAGSAAQIAAATNELLSGMEQAAEAMTSIKEASLQNVSGMKDIESTAHDLSRISGALSALLGHYRVRL